MNFPKFFPGEGRNGKRGKGIKIGCFNGKATRLRILPTEVIFDRGEEERGVARMSAWIGIGKRVEIRL